jgi:acetyl-CoA synthetase
MSNHLGEDVSPVTPILDSVPRDAPGAQEIGFAVPERYNASAILFDNLAAGRDGQVAVTGPAGTRTYAELAADACRFGAGLLSLGARRGDRVLLFLDDTPAYPAALFGAIRAGLVPVLTNTLTPSDLLQYYLADSGAAIAVCDAAFLERFNRTALTGTRLERLIVVNGAPDAGAPAPSISATQWLTGFTTALEAADTHRDDMAFWMYSSGSTGRPKGIVHLQHDMLYTHLAYGRHLLALTGDDICFSVPKIFFAYGLGNSITFPFAAARRCRAARDRAGRCGRRCCRPAQPPTAPRTVWKAV